MQLASPARSGPLPTDVATALADAAARLGHRPAITVLRERGREEQSVASLAQWAAKGAHLLELELLLEPGERIALRAPVGWPAAAVALAAWWAGCTLTLDADAEVAVVHEHASPPAGATDVLWLGDAIDGAPLDEPDGGSSAQGEAWVHAVQTFPDQPPTSRAGPDLPALEAAGRTWTQRELLVEADGLGDDGPLGVAGNAVDGATALLAVAARPLLVGRPTVVLADADVTRDDAAGDRVTSWL